MSVKHFWMKNTDGAPSFLCGAISVICDCFNNALFDRGSNLYVSADVFQIDKCDDTSFENTLKSRLITYMQNTHADDPENFNADLNSLSITLEKSKQSVNRSLSLLFEKYETLDKKLTFELDNFCASIGHYFSKTVAVYSVTNDLFKHNPLIKEYYAPNVKDVLIVEFSEYALMLVIGTYK